MGCCHSLSILNDYFQIPNSASSGMSNNRSPAMSINGDTDDTVPLTSSKNKNASRDFLIHNEKNFSRTIPLLEERDPNFENIEENRRLSSYTMKTDSSASSIASLEKGLTNSIKENAFLNQDKQNENSDLDQTQDQNISNISNISNSKQDVQPIPITNLLYNPDELLMPTEDEGGISGEMDSSFDDDT